MTKNYDCDILCITEHWVCKPFDKNDCTNLLDGYYCGSMYCRNVSQNGGAAIYVRNNLKCTELDISDLIIESVFEAVVLVFNYFTVICVYRPPSGSIEVFFDQLNLCIERINNRKKFIFICGDLNIDILSDNQNSMKGRKQLECFMAEHGVISLTNEPTRISSNASTSIDHIITNVPSEILQHKCNVEVGISDHTMQQATISIAQTKKKPEKMFEYKRIVTVEKEIQFIEALNNESWSLMYNAESADDKFEQFHKKFKEMFDSFFPIKKRNVTVRQKKDWITKGLKITSINHRELSKEAKGHKDIEFKNYFVKYRKIYRKVVQNAKMLSVKEEITTSKNVTKAVWRVINRSMGKRESETPNIKVNLSDSETICDDPTLVANAFNVYYSNVASKLIGPDAREGTLPTESCTFSMFLTSVTENDVTLAISKLKNKKCCGHDDITDDIVKRCHVPLLKPLQHLIQASFEQGIFPTRLKISKVLPLYKKGDKQCMGNYRPVANISTFAKIFEFVMDMKVRSYLYKHNLMSPTQFGFLKDRSTSDAIIDFIHCIYKAFETRTYVSGLLFDMSKAFDLVDHNILLRKMEAHGIRGIILKWFKSYLADRKQFVEINQTTGNNRKKYRSNFHSVLYGVPQGSILGPLLFIIFINDLSKFLKAGKLVNFADDANVLIRAITIEDLEELLYLAFEQMKEWCYLNNLVLNDDKTNIIQFRTNDRVQKNVNSSFKNLHVNSAKFLGIHLDQHLRWHAHLQELKIAISKTIFGIKRIRTMTDEKTALLAYYGMFHSKISYGTSIWGNSTMMPDVFKIQKKAVRAVFSLTQRTSCKHYFVEKNIMTIYSIYIYQILKYVKKNECLFKKSKDLHKYVTRQNDKIYSDFVHLNVSENDIMYLGPKLFNILPSNIRSLPLKQFSNYVKLQLTKCAFYCLKDYFQYGLNFKHQIL